MAINSDKIQLNEKINIVIKETTASTNKDAKEIYTQTGENTLVIAEEQTAGRGRLDRKFCSPKGKGLYMSLAFKPEKYFENIQLITPFAAVAVSRAIEKLTGAKTGIKWVNDIYMNQRKVCGILSEIVFKDGVCDFVIVGVGINVHKLDFPDDLKNIATSIENETGISVSRNELASEFANEFLGFRETKICPEEYKNKSVILGKNITVYSGNDIFEAYAESIDENAGLVARTTDGIKRINAGEVSIRL